MGSILVEGDGWRVDDDYERQVTELRDELQQTLGDAYTLERELTGGGMSRVFVAQERALARKVVVKVLPPTLAAEVSIERFKREIQVAAGLQHAHIVPVLNAGETRGMPYYTMPFVDGESLRARLMRGGALPINETISILRDVSRALAYAHERGIVHRDIKPDNVMMSGGSAVVTDFGIAKAISAARTGGGAAPTITQIGTALGTPAYMAPEQAAADPSTDHRADLYALGCMAYEMLAGQPPFVEKSAQQLLAAHMGRTPDAIESRRDDTPSALATLIMRCLEKDATKRPASASEFVRQLETVTSAGGHAAMPPILLAGPGATKRALAIYAVAFAAVVILAKAATIVIGLPDWVAPGASIVMALGLPAILATAYVQRVTHRAMASTPTFTPGGTPSSANHGTMATLAIKASPHVSWRRTGLGGMYAVSAFVVLVAAFMILRAMGIGPGASLFAKGTLASGDQVLVADFKATGPDTALGPVLAEAMRSSLASSRSVRVVAASTVGSALERMQLPAASPVTFDVAKQIATREGIKAILRGEITAVSGGYLVTARLEAAANGDVLASAQESAKDAAELIPAMDRIGRKVRGNIGESLKRVQSTPALARVTTASLEALRAFTEGARASDVERNFPKAIQLLDKAVALDSSFGMAYNKLAIAMGNAGPNLAPRLRDVLNKGFARRDQFAEAERLAFLGNYYVRNGDRGQGIAAYEEGARKYPELLPSIANNLALSYGTRREYARAESLYTWVIRERPDYATPRSNIITVQAAGGRLAEALKSARALRDLPATAPLASSFESRVLYAMGQVDSARAVAERARSNPRDVVDVVGPNEALARMAIRDGRVRETYRYKAAAVAANAASGVVVPPFDATLDSVDVSVWILNQPEAALRQMEALYARATPQQRTLPMANRFALLGRAERAKEILARFESNPDSIVRRTQAPARQNAEGFIATAEGRYTDAVAAFRSSDRLPDGPRLLCPICVDVGIAMAFDRAGMADSAIAVYEHFVTTPYLERMGHDHQLGWVLRRIGELYEVKKEPQKALDAYRKFVDLWKNADPEIQPQVTEVKAKITRLEAEVAKRG